MNGFESITVVYKDQSEVIPAGNILRVAAAVEEVLTCFKFAEVLGSLQSGNLTGFSSTALAYGYSVLLSRTRIEVKDNIVHAINADVRTGVISDDTVTSNAIVSLNALFDQLYEPEPEEPAKKPAAKKPKGRSKKSS